MNSPWIICGIGTLFCAGGVFLFWRNAFEEDKKMVQPVLVILAGIVLITIGTAKYFHLIK